MNKIVAMILAVCLVLALCACGKSTPKFDPEQELKSKIQADAAVYCALQYSNVKNVLVSVTNINHNGDEYTAQGKVTVIDNYGDKYVGNFDAEYTLNGESFTKNNLDISTPKKQ